MGKGAGRDEVGSAQGPTVRDKHFTKTFLCFYSSNNTFHETSKTVDLANTLFSIPPLKCQQAGISVCLGASVDCFASSGRVGPTQPGKQRRHYYPSSSLLHLYCGLRLMREKISYRSSLLSGNI